MKKYIDRAGGKPDGHGHGGNNDYNHDHEPSRNDFAVADSLAYG